MNSLKKQELRKCVVALAAFLGISGASLALGQQADAQTNTVPVQILGINDFHGALSTTGSYYGAGGTKVSNCGTAALMAGYFNQAETDFKTANPNGVSMRVQSGDMVGASPANSGLLQDQPTMRILQQMKFKIGTLGNHEFDEGLGEFNRILTGGKPAADAGFYDIVYKYNNDYTPEQLKGGFELVIANVKEKATGNIPFGWKPYEIVNVGTEAEPINIGVIGVVTQEIPNLVLAEHHQDYNFTDPATEIANYAKVIRETEKVNAIVVLGHTPSVQEGDNGVTGETADIITKVNQIDPDNSVDAFFAGHNHQYTDGVVEKTRVVQSTSQGKGYIDLQGTYDKDAKDFVGTPGASVNPVRPNVNTDKEKYDKAPAADTAVQAIVADADTRVKEVTEEKIGDAAKAEDISRDVNELGESAAGNLITDGQVYMAHKNGIPADFAMTNNGGIRADLKVGADGSITWGSAQAVQPFGNIMQIVEMTGEQIRTVLNQQTLSWTYDDKAEKFNSSGYFLQAAGLEYTVTDNATSEKTKGPFTVKTLTKSDGTPIDPNTTYKVVINDFLFGGGDGFKEFENAKLVGAMDPDTETFINYIKDKTAEGKKISASIEGRKVTVEQFKPIYEAEKQKFDSLIPTNYAAGSWDTYKKALENFNKVVNNPDSSAKALKDARKDVETAAAELVDLTELQSLYGAEKKKFDSLKDKKDDYTVDSWNAYDKAILNADSVLGNSGSTKEDVKKAIEELATASKNLKTKLDAAKAALTALLEQEKAANRDKNNYTADSWNKYVKAKTAAEDAATNGTEEAKVIAAQEDFETAISNLVDVSKLKNLYDTEVQADRKATDYSTDTWDVYKKARDAAKVVLDDTDAKQTEVDKAYDDLDAAIKNLKTQAQADKETTQAKLKEAIQKAKDSLREKDYTSSSWSIYQAALKTAEDLLNNPNATTEQLEKALSDLQTAINGLQKLSPNPSDDNKGGNNQGGGATTKPSSNTTKKSFPSSTTKKTTTGSAEKSDNKSYPKTGAVVSLIPMAIGAGLIASAGYIYKKRQEEE